MNVLEIIRKKRDNQILSKEEIDYFILNYTNGNIPDYQAASLIMAIFLNGLNKEETTNLTLAMANSGDILDLSKLKKVIVDKHSTGGVGDKVSLILLPIVASLGVPVAKMSGRGLGFTGGTADKLESIPGYNTQISIENFIQNVERIGISMITQTMSLAPADKKLYALRDVISCVESIPLIASSIMSKKIASGAEKIVLDVTVGSGAFMKKKQDAIKLANQMIEIGRLTNKETVCILTNMDEPLGYAVGNTLEVIEAIEFLRGNMPSDLKKVVLELGCYMIKLAGLGENLNENKSKIIESIGNGKAYSKFLNLIENQGGDISYIKDIKKFKKAKYIVPIISDEYGYIKKIDAQKIGEIASFLGAGRIKKDDTIKNEVGIVLNKKVGDLIKPKDILAYIHADDQQKVKFVQQEMKSIIKITDKECKKLEPVLDVIL